MPITEPPHNVHPGYKIPRPPERFCLQAGMVYGTVIVLAGYRAKRLNLPQPKKGPPNEIH